MKNPSKEWYEGFDAVYQRHEGMDECPYEPLSQKAQDWLAGWDAGNEEARFEASEHMDEEKRLS